MAEVTTTVTMRSHRDPDDRARQGSTPASCDVVDTETGRVVGQVPEGTRSGLFYCGSDGAWHFGTVILDWSRVVSEPAPAPEPTIQ